MGEREGASWACRPQVPAAQWRSRGWCDRCGRDITMTLGHCSRTAYETMTTVPTTSRIPQPISAPGEYLARGWSDYGAAPAVAPRPRLPSPTLQWAFLNERRKLRGIDYRFRAHRVPEYARIDSPGAGTSALLMRATMPPAGPRSNRARGRSARPRKRRAGRVSSASAMICCVAPTVGL
jgi:hypothetical protein